MSPPCKKTQPSRLLVPAAQAKRARPPGAGTHAPRAAIAQSRYAQELHVAASSVVIAAATSRATASLLVAGDRPR